MKRILVGLSGGVDSAVAAYLLMQQGFDVTAGFMINYITDDDSCTTKADLAVAKEVAAFLGIKLHTFDFQQEYQDRIVKYIVDSYRDGLTPNPDVMCNSEVKFKLFLEEGIALGFDAVATGHYARVISSEMSETNEVEKSHTITNYELGITSITQQKLGTTYQLLKGIDSNKDQSYFLSGLNQDQLSKAMFPLGGMTKPEVREIAKQANLPNALRKDSQGICFIGKIPMKQFLQQHIPVQKGDILDTTGKVVGQHDGVRGYTIGQRKGIGVAASEPLFVIKKDITTNTITVGFENEAQLYSHDIHIKNRHWVGEQYKLPFTGHAKIRYRQMDQEMTLSSGTRDKGQGTNIISNEMSETNGDEKSLSITNDKLTAHFTEQQRAIASGQIIVVYDGDVVVGNGVII